MRVALVGPEIEENLALRSIAASLKQAGHEPQIFDFRAREDLDAVADQIVRWNPSLVGFSMIFTARADEFMDLAGAQRAKGSSAHLTAGGHFAALHAREILRDTPALDSIVHGEGEEAMVDLANAADNTESVLGLSVRVDGEVRSTGVRPGQNDLDARPWSEKPTKFAEYLGHPIASILSSRGCWASCHFCSIHAFHSECGDAKRYRQRDPERVADEMAHLFHDRGVQIFNFQDDNFLVPSRSTNLKRLTALRAALHRRDVGRIALQVKTRPDCVDPEVVDLLIEMGLFRFFLGIETDAVVGLKTLGRGIEREENHRALELLREREVHTCFNLLMFDPESTLDAIQENVDFMRKQSYFPLNFCRVEVYGGTAIEARLKSEGRLLGDYRGYSYKIRDPRAQRAYEIFREVFWPRNFGPNGAHHASMRADYSLHVLRHFHPARASRSLERKVKGLVQDVNESSASLMDRVLAFAASDQWSQEESLRSLIEELQAERSVVDRALLRRVDTVLREMESARTTGERRKLLQTAAAAAALVVSGPGCPKSHDNTHMCEMAPNPCELTDQRDTHMCEMAPAPMDAGPRESGGGPVEVEPEAPDGGPISVVPTEGTDAGTAAPPPPPMAADEAARVAGQLQRWIPSRLRPLFEEHGQVGATWTLRLAIRRNGRVASCSTDGQTTFGDALCRAVAQRFRATGIRSGGALETPVLIEPPAEVVREPFDNTHMCEMAPNPIEPGTGPTRRQ